jgi:serine/threonine-protein kinase
LEKNLARRLRDPDQKYACYGRGNISLPEVAMNERDLFTAALRHEDTAAYLRQACAGDTALRRRVEILLEAHRLAGDFLERDPASGPPTVGDSVLRELGAGRALPRVHLRDPLTEDVTPVSLPGSAELPAASPNGAGRYQLVGELGRGGMGAVLKGRDTDLGRDVAVKVLLEAHQEKPELVGRFVEEAQVGGQLQHPGVVPVYELGRFPDGRPFFAMKLVKGQTLSKLLRERQSPADELPRFLQIFAQVCQAVGYAHARGVIHRDLKPGNVMVGSFGEVQVMDWGLAKVLRQAADPDEEAPTQIRTVRSAGSDTPGSGSDTRAGSVLGTPAYMAPEQANGAVDRLDERADVFGLGAILCEILTGQPPYTGRDGEEVYRQAAAADTGNARTRLADCGADAELVGLAERCLAADPAGRPRDAGAVAAAVTAHQESVAERLRRAELERAAAEARAQEEQNTRRMAEARAAEERRRRWAQLGLAAAVLLLVVLGGGAAGWFWWQRAETIRDAEAALAEADAHLAAGRWAQAGAALERAEGRLGGAGPDALRERLRQARADAQVVATLEKILLRKADVKGGKFDDAGADPLYAAAFRDYGLDVDRQTPDEAAARLRAAAVRGPLLAALDDWAIARPSGSAGRARLRAAADAAGDSPWRRAYRAANDAGDPAQLQAVAADAAALDQPPIVLALLGRSLQRAGRPAEAVALLRQAQRRHPADLWVNHELASALVHLKPPRRAEAVGYFRAALALRPDSPGTWFNLGLILSETGDQAGAAACYRRALEIDSNYAHAHHNLAKILYVRKDWQGAVAACRRALELTPNDALTHAVLGLTLVRSGDVERGFRHLRRALELAPDLAMAHVALGDALLVRGDLEGAAGAYRRALARDPDLAPAHNNLGVVFDRKRDSARAAACYRRAAELEPDKADCQDNLGTALLNGGDADGAQACFLRALALDPRYAAAHNHLGLLWRSRKDFARAAAAHRRALELDPRLAEAHSYLGLALLHQGDVAGAVAACCRAVELAPRDARAQHNLGSALRRQGHVRAAAAFYHRALHLDPNSAPSHNELGIISCDVLHDYDGAARHFRRAIALKPDDADHHYNLGNALRGQKRWAEAAACYRLAIAIDLKHTRAHFGLGRALQAKGQLDEAITAYRAAIKLGLKEAALHNDLGVALADKEQWDEAIVEYRKAIKLDYNEARPHFGLGRALQAKGQLDEAIREYLATIQIDPKVAVAYGALGETYARQGRFAEAQVALQRCLKLLPPADPLRQIVTRLLKQNEQSIDLDQKSSAILKGEAKAKNPSELLRLGRFCLAQKKQPAAAARLYAYAFAAESALADDLDAGDCYAAARAAALAGCGQGRDAPAVDEKGRAGWRQRALEWLRADLKLWEKQAADDPAAVREALARWQKDPALAGLRDDAALARLPEAERAAWRALWADVAALREQASRP